MIPAMAFAPYDSNLLPVILMLIRFTWNADRTPPEQLYNLQQNDKTAITDGNLNS